METERKRISLVEDTYAYIGRASDEENAEEFKTRLQEYISILKEVVESDFDKLTDKDLYELLSKVYGISLDEDDYLKMLSMYNNKKYTFIHRIPTTMTFKGRATEGHGRSFDWWEQLYQVYYLAATSDTFEFDYNKTYSKEEIKKLTANKNIVLLQQEEEAINSIRGQEEYESIPTLNIDINGYGDNISKFVLDNYGLFGKLLRKRFTKKTVLKDMREMIDDLTAEMQDIFSDIKSSDPNYSGTAKVCKEWFDSSSEKAEYQGIQKTLRPNKSKN